MSLALVKHGVDVNAKDARGSGATPPRTMPWGLYSHNRMGPRRAAYRVNEPRRTAWRGRGSAHAGRRVGAERTPNVPPVLQQGVLRCRGTALHTAAWAGRYEIVRLLLAHGADLNAKDDDGFEIAANRVGVARYRVCARARVCACVRVCVCVRACVRACVCLHAFGLLRVQGVPWGSTR